MIQSLADRYVDEWEDGDWDLAQGEFHFGMKERLSVSKGNWSTFVVVIDWGNKSWTMGPFHHHAKAEKAIEALPTIDGLNAWIEPVVRPEDMQATIKVWKGEM